MDRGRHRGGRRGAHARPGRRAGCLRDVRGARRRGQPLVAAEGHLGVGDTLRARMADTGAETLRVAAVYERAAGLGDVVMDPALARRHAARPGGRGGLRGRRAAPPTLVARYAARPPRRRALNRGAYRDRCTAADTSRRGASG